MSQRRNFGESASFILEIPMRVHLRAIMESPPFSKCQFAYRIDKSTETSLHELSSTVERSFDIEGAPKRWG